MPTEGFHSEWFSINDHRVLLECRASFPDTDHKFIASVVAKTLDVNCVKARLVRVYFDDKSCTYSIEAATTEPQDKNVEKLVTRIVQDIYGSGNYHCEMTIVKRGDEDSDHYHHMEHLSVQLDVATDRWA